MWRSAATVILCLCCSGVSGFLPTPVRHRSPATTTTCAVNNNGAADPDDTDAAGPKSISEPKKRGRRRRRVGRRSGEKITSRHRGMITQIGVDLTGDGNSDLIIEPLWSAAILLTTVHSTVHTYQLLQLYAAYRLRCGRTQVLI